MAEGLLSLKWSRHSLCFIEHLARLRSKKLYSDVTIVCDGQYYHLHRFVLALCSRYFCEIFDTAHSQHPIIILNNIKCSTLDSLLDFIYVGEAQVLKEELPLLIKAAENLQVWGLSPTDTEKSPASYQVPENVTDGSSVGDEPEKKSSKKLLNELEWKECDLAANTSKNAVSNDGKTIKCKSGGGSTELYSNSCKRSCSCSSLSGDKRQCLDISSSEKCSRDNNDKSYSSGFTRHKEGDLLPPESSLASSSCAAKDEPHRKCYSKSSTEEVTLLDNERPASMKLEPEDSAAVSCNDVSVSPNNSASESLCSISASPDSVKHERHFLDLYSNAAEEPTGASSFITPFFENASLGCSLLNTTKMSEVHAEATEEQGNAVLRCSLCSYETTSQPLLRLHSLSHADQMSFNNELSSIFTGDSSFFPSERSMCSVDKSFPGGKLYSSERSFPCLFCNYVATQRSNLAKHIRIHTGEKPFACAHCPYRCTQKHHLSRHVARQHRLSMSM
ncbi:BTB/POZ domain [Trinorchestia longiramus]|nr:BTB/POZ domain [Trinorchestia longiramus]